YSTDTAPTAIYTLSLHDALPIFAQTDLPQVLLLALCIAEQMRFDPANDEVHPILLEHLKPGTRGIAPVKDEGQQRSPLAHQDARSEEHTSELQSPYDLVCRIMLE